MRPSQTPEAGVTQAVEGMLPEIRSLIEEARHRAVTAANLSMVTLYWNIGRVITTELQSTPGRAGYGEALLTRLGDRLNTEYGRGFSRANLQDMRRFHDFFEIRQPVAGKSVRPAIRQPAAGKSLALAIRQPVAAESAERLLVDFAKHHHLGWTHRRAAESVRPTAGGWRPREMNPLLPAKHAKRRERRDTRLAPGVSPSARTLTAVPLSFRIFSRVSRAPLP